jgi:putative two-component system response regulator
MTGQSPVIASILTAPHSSLENPRAAGHDAPMHPSPDPRDVRILVVDDQPVIRVALRGILQSVGYRCTEASGMEEALDWLEREPFHMVLSDIEMPGGSGLDLVKSLEPRFPDLAMIMVSGLDDADLALDCLQHGAYGYVLKPFQPREILLQVSSALRRRMLELDYVEREHHLERRVREATEMIRHSREELSHRLIAASEYRDHETGAHVRRIGLYAGELAKLLGWSEADEERIRAAAPMHDIGKIGVPDAILQKPGELTEAEWVVMKRHTTMGAAILKGSKVPFIQMGARIAACHHEKWDGGGYPNGLKAEAIPLEARITALVDVYDALANRRYYKEPWPEDRIVPFLERGAGVHFDPVLVNLFLEYLPTFRAILESHPDEDASAIFNAEAP